MIIEYSADAQIPKNYVEQLVANFDFWLDRDLRSPIWQYEKAYLFIDKETETVAGFQTVNDSCECLNIEVKKEFSYQEIARQLIQKSKANIRINKKKIRL